MKDKFEARHRSDRRVAPSGYRRSAQYEGKHRFADIPNVERYPENQTKTVKQRWFGNKAVRVECEAEICHYVAGDKYPLTPFGKERFIQRTDRLIIDEMDESRAGLRLLHSLAPLTLKSMIGIWSSEEDKADLRWLYPYQGSEISLLIHITAGDLAEEFAKTDAEAPVEPQFRVKTPPPDTV